MGVPSQYGATINPKLKEETLQPDVTDVLFITEQIRRMTDWQLTQLASALTEDYLADKLVPKLEVSLAERDNPLTRIDMPKDED